MNYCAHTILLVRYFFSRSEEDVVHRSDIEADIFDEAWELDIDDLDLVTLRDLV